MKLIRKCVIAALLCIIVSTGIASLRIGISSASVNLPTDMPYVFVYPQNTIAEPGQNFTITVGVYNLSDNVYTCMQEWLFGQPLPPYDPLGTHRYPMGYLIGFDITFSWDPNILEYKNHTVTVPLETYPNPIPPVNFTGTLHQPIQPILDNVDATSGTYELAKSHVGKNYFNGNGTLFQMTFKVKKEGGSPLTLSNSKLVAPAYSTWIGKQYDFPGIIPNQVRSGFFLTSGARTRVYGVDVKVSVGTRTFSPPVIAEKENASVKISIRNEGVITDYYNLTLYHTYPNGTISFIQEWLNQEINTTERDQYFEVPITSSYLVRGNHTFTANATISHATEISIDTLSKQARAISADLLLNCTWSPVSRLLTPSSQYAYVDETVIFNANKSIHSETSGNFIQYRWEIRESPTAPPRVTLTNSTPTTSYAFPSPKNWTVSLIVTDNFGVTYDSLRPATAAYKLDFIVEAKKKIEGGLPWDLVALAIILVVIIVIAGYLYMRRRR